MVPKIGACRDGLLRKKVVQAVPHHQMHGREMSCLGKSRFVMHAKPGGVGLVLDNLLDIERNELQRSLGQTAATGFIARQLFLFQQKHGPSGGGQYMGQQASGGPGADNGEIVKGGIAVGQLAVSIASMRHGVHLPAGSGPAMVTIGR